MKLKFIVILLLLVNYLYAQDFSFKKRFEEACITLAAKKRDEANRVADSLLTVSDTDEERMRSYMLKAKIHRMQGEQEKSFLYALKARDISNSTFLVAGQASSSRLLSSIFREIGLMNLAKRYLDAAEMANEEQKGASLYLFTRIKIAHERAFQAFAAKDDVAARDLLLKVADLVKADSKDDKKTVLIKATNKQLLGISYLNLGQIEEAEKYLHESLAIVGNHENLVRPYTYCALAEIALKRNDLNQGEHYLELMKPYLSKNGAEGLKTLWYSAIASYYLRKNDIQQSVRYNDSVRYNQQNHWETKIKAVDRVFDQLVSSKDNYKNKYKIALACSIALSSILLLIALYHFTVWLRIRKPVEEMAALHSSNPGSSRGIKKNATVQKLPGEDCPYPKEQKEGSELKEIQISKETEDRLLLAIEKFEDAYGYLDKDISLSNMASDLGTNRRYVSYILRKYKNQGFYSYIQDKRIKYIVNRIKLNTELLDYKLTQLASISGFHSSSKFSTAFKSEVGFSPSAYIQIAKRQAG